MLISAIFPYLKCRDKNKFSGFKRVKVTNENFDKLNFLQVIIVAFRNLIFLCWKYIFSFHITDYFILY